MRIFKKKYQVKSNTVGFLYRNNTFERKLNSAYYETWDFKDGTELWNLILRPRISVNSGRIYRFGGLISE